MTPAQPALDAMMEGVWAVCALAEKGNKIGYRIVQASARTKEEAAGAGLARFQKEYPGHSFSSVEAMPIAMPSALAAEVRAQRETIAGLTARLEAMTKVLGSFKFSCNEASFYKDCALEFISPHSALFRLPITSDKAFLVAGLEARRLAALSGEAPND
jgi:hypothetical protein